MPDPATSRQKQFLRQLGYKDAAKVTKQQASQLIDKLLADEKASGKTFPCPYCKAKFGPRPKRERKCPSCGKTIIHLSGKFYTQEQADTLYQTDWMKETRQDVKTEVKEEWKEERQFRKEFDEPMIVGYTIKAGANCPHAKHLDGLFVLIEDAFDNPDLLPPFENCKHDTCECDYTPARHGEVKGRTKVAQFSDPNIQAKLTTRKTSSVGIEHRKKSSGCASVLIICIVLIAGLALQWM